LATLHQDLLSFRLDAGERVKLEFEGFAVGGRVEIDIILLALVLDNNLDIC
jgi:hypothetical protein